MTQQIHTFLMFEGKAQEAMDLYISLFGGEILRSIPNEDGTIMHATFTLKGQEFMAIDSPINHDFSFTPAISIMVDCESIDNINRVFSKLVRGGAILMPLGDIPGYKMFGWVQDKYGVSWQLYVNN